MSGPGGLSPAALDTLLAGWNPGESTLVQFLVDRGALDRLGAQTLGAVLKGYVQLPAAGLCALFKSLSRDHGRAFGAREAPTHDCPHSPPPLAASSTGDGARTGLTEAVPGASRAIDAVDGRRRALEAVPKASRATDASPPAPAAPGCEITTPEFARLSLRAQIFHLRSECPTGPGPRDATRHPSEPGDPCGRYTLIRRIGESAHAVVFQALDRDERTVTLKLPRHTAAPASLPRFTAQARLHAGLTHAGVLPLLDAGGRDGVPYLAYADMGASNIATYFRRHAGRLEVWTLAQLLVDVAQVLDAAAKVDVVHGDLTPANILICERDARVRLTDFGMRVPGAPADPFTAPELASGDQGTIQSDMYSLGVIVQRAAIGEAGTGDLLRQRRPDLPPALVTTLDRMTARSPGRRPASWDEAITAVVAACPRSAAVLV